MSSGADRKRSQGVPEAFPQDLVQLSDLSEGRNSEVRPFSTPWNACGTLTAGLRGRSRHPSSLNAVRDKSPRDGLSRTCPYACAVQVASVHARRAADACHINLESPSSTGGAHSRVPGQPGTHSMASPGCVGILEEQHATPGAV